MIFLKLISLCGTSHCLNPAALDPIRNLALLLLPEFPVPLRDLERLKTPHEPCLHRWALSILTQVHKPCLQRSVLSILKTPHKPVSILTQLRKPCLQRSALSILMQVGQGQNGRPHFSRFWNSWRSARGGRTESVSGAG